MRNTYFEVCGGLCNRLRVIKSALSWAKETNNVGKIIWKKDMACFASFYELFEMTEELEKYLEFDTSKTNMIVNKATKLGHCVIGKYYKNINRNEYESIKDNISGSYISTCHEFCCEGSYDWLKPLDSIQTVLNDEDHNFYGETIGIHIRGTDNVKAIEASPVSMFEDVIEDEIRNNPEIRFFISTDDENVKRSLVSKYHGRVRWNDVCYRRDTKEGVIDAVVDLFTLAKTSKIYGSYWSSFSEVAAAIGNIPLTIVEKSSL